MRKSSQKREAVYEALLATNTHPSAEMIYDELKAANPTIGIATVYRNLKLFIDEGKAVSVGFVDGRERFDANTVEHTHFVCERCGRVLDCFDAELPKELKKKLSDTYGYRVESITLKGVCGSCALRQIN